MAAARLPKKAALSFRMMPAAEELAVASADPDTATVLPDLPRPGTGLRWDEFIRDLTSAYRARFED